MPRSVLLERSYRLMHAEELRAGPVLWPEPSDVSCVHDLFRFVKRLIMKRWDGELTLLGLLILIRGMPPLFALLGFSLAAAQPARIVEPRDSRLSVRAPQIRGHPEIHVPSLPGLWVITGGVPESRVHNWIKIRNIGDANHPWSILYFAPEPIRATGRPEYSYALPSEQYRVLAAFTAAQPCRAKQPSLAEVQAGARKGEDPYWGVFQIDQAIDGKRQSRCFLLERDNCRYFSRIADMPIRWKRNDIDGVANMALTLNCDSEESEKWNRIYKLLIPDPS